MQIAISLVWCQRWGRQVFIDLEHLFTIYLLLHSAPGTRCILLPPLFGLGLVQNIFMTDDTARYFNALQQIMLLFILGELNETEGDLQFGYFASLKQFDIQLTHPGIIACAQWFNGRV